MEPAVDLTRHDLGFADGQFESLAAHRLDQHGELEFAATLHGPGIGPLGGQDANGYVANDLRVKAILHQSAGQLRAVLAGQRPRC